jgi:CxxC motif-containing protein (DUF1111 family)
VKLRARPIVFLVLLLFTVQVFSQTDPGVRGGAVGAGGPLNSVASNFPFTILDFFDAGQDAFEEVASVKGPPVSPDAGLGPRFNALSCASCHSQPAVGGTSPAVNPEVAAATANGATNTVPSFITINGPVREARFKTFADGTPDGGVHALYTIAGRSDAGTCTAAVISQPNFAAAIAGNNIIFRIPTPVFGAGLIENIDESDLLAYQASLVGNSLGIAGTFNHNGNDGTISRFGWKAQNKSLELFSGEAYNVEMGVSNELFTQERPSPNEDRASGLPVQCRVNKTPEDHTNFDEAAVDTPSDAVMFAMFMRLLKPPVKSDTVPGGSISIITGEALFTEVGCAKCHRVAFTTAPSDITDDLSSVQAKLFSDLQIHQMGTGLMDSITQGTAGGNQFRTAPLWGLGQRIFFLHDGRTTNLLTAISAHSSTGSEANTVVLNFNALSSTDKQHLVNFLRSL